MKILYLNLLEGCKEEHRFNNVVKFIKNHNPDVFGLSELNNWDKNKFERLKLFQREVGYDKVVFCKAKTGYHLALFSKKKFSTASKITNGLWHGLIIAKTDFNGQEITFMLTHLCPINEDKRLKEIDVIKEYLKESDKVILMGDLNSLSNQDVYDEEEIIKEMREQKIIKFGKDKLRKDVITKILDLKFIDAVRKFLDKFEYSVPTPINKDKDHLTKLRLDYIFVKNLSSNLVGAKIIRESETDQLSDHYPVLAEFTF